MARKHNSALNTVLMIQGSYFLITGIWPLLNMDSFIQATGPKQDTWLVEMIGLLSASIGLTFIVSSIRRHQPPLVLAFAVATSFLLMDVLYVTKGVASRIYLVDAAVQTVFLVAVAFFTFKHRRGRKQ